MNAARKLQFGRVWVNGHLLPLSAELPHGGYKQSGYGKDTPVYSMEEYTQLKHVAIKHRLSTKCVGGLHRNPPLAAVSRYGSVALRSRSGVRELRTRLCRASWATLAKRALASRPVLGAQPLWLVRGTAPEPSRTC